MTRQRAWCTKAASLAMSIAAHVALLAAAWSLPPLPAARRGEVIEVSILRIEPPATQAGTGSPVAGRRRAAGRSPARRTRGVGAAAVAPSPALPPGPGVTVAIEGATGRAVAFAGDAAGDLAGGAILAGVTIGIGGGDVIADRDSNWLRKHQRTIERLIQREMDGTPYPPQARRRWLTGKVRVAFTLQPDGHVRDVRVVRSSGRDVLDHCAVETVIDAAPYPRPPADQEVEIPFEFRLVSM